MPFGGWHSDAGQALASLVPPRLQHNRRLHRELARGIERSNKRLIVPFETERLLRLFEYIARGLVFHHWRVALRSSTLARAIIRTAEARPLFDRLMAASGDRVSANLGEGTFQYSGLRHAAQPEHTVWQFIVFGGLRFAEGDEAPTRIDVLTGSPEFLSLVPA